MRQAHNRPNDGLLGIQTEAIEALDDCRPEVVDREIL